MDRSLTSMELRIHLKHKEDQLKKAILEIHNLKQENKEISEWNIKWQQHVWNKEMIKHCEVISKEFQKLSEPETKIIDYLLNSLESKAGRHLRAISRATGISLSTAQYNLKKLTKKQLIRCYSRNSNKKKYYCLPEARRFLKQQIK
jgi:DNA-binding MarR family transcriptional regulator